MKAFFLQFKALNLSYIARHKGRSLLSIVGVAVGVIMIAAILILQDSTVTSIDRHNKTIKGNAQIELTTAAVSGLDANFIKTISSMSEVKAVAGVLRVPCQIKGKQKPVQILAIGADENLKKLAGNVGKKKSIKYYGKNKAGLIITGQLKEKLGYLPQNKELSVIFEGKKINLPVVAVFSRQVGTYYNEGRFIIMPLVMARSVFSRTALSSIYISTKSKSKKSIDNLAAKLKLKIKNKADIISSSDITNDLEKSTTSSIAFMMVFSSLTLLIGSYLIYNIMSLTAKERRKEYAILKCLGEGKGSIVARFMGEALVFGIIGSAIGLVVAIPVGRYMVSAMPAYILEAYEFSTNARINPQSLIIAASIGIIATLWASLLPALSLVKVHPVEALSEETISLEETKNNKFMALVGSLVFILGLCGSLFKSNMNLFMFLTLLGLITIAPFFFTFVLNKFKDLFSNNIAISGPSQLVSATLAQNKRRHIGTASVICLSLTIVVAIGGSASNMKSSIDNYSKAFRRLDSYISTSSDTYGSVFLNPLYKRKLLKMKEVKRVSNVHFAFINYKKSKVLLVGEDPYLYSIYKEHFFGENSNEIRNMLKEGQVVVSTQIAWTNNLRAGDFLTLTTVKGLKNYKIGAIVKSWSWTNGTIGMSDKTFATDFSQPQINAAGVHLKPGYIANNFKKKLVVNGFGDLNIETGTDIESDITKEAAIFFAPFFQMRNIAILVALIAVFNTLAIAINQRRREIGLLRAIGIKRSEIAASVIIETFVITFIGFLAGGVIGTLLQLLMIYSMKSTYGLPISFAIESSQLIIGAAAALLIAILGSALPAYKAAKFPILESIQYE